MHINFVLISMAAISCMLGISIWQGMLKGLSSKTVSVMMFTGVFWLLGFAQEIGSMSYVAEQMGDYQNMPDFEGANKFQAATAWVFSLIPVIVLTTSTSEEDIIKSYEIKANCYITKPVVLDQFTAIVQPITPFWSTIVTLPEGW